MVKNFLLVLFLITPFLSGQSYNLQSGSVNIKFDQIGLEQGLSQSSVQAIVQDAYGFMWFGTQDGLNRYDGYSIKVFKHNAADSNSIAEDKINCLLSDSRSNLWIGTRGGGLDHYILEENKFFHYKHRDDDLSTIRDNEITTLFEDSNRNIWVGTPKGLDRYDHSKNQFFHYTLEGKNDFSAITISINVITEDTCKNEIWIGTTGGLFKIRINNIDSVIRYDNLNPASGQGENVLSLYIDSSGSLWIGTWNTVLKRYIKESNTFLSYEKTPKAIRTIYEDINGNFWLGSVYAGLNCFNKSTNEISNIPAVQNDFVNVLYEDISGILWIGTIFRGAFIFNPQKNQFRHYLDDSRNPNVVMAILEDKYGDLWVGTFGNGLKHFNSRRDKIKTFLFNQRDTNSLSSNRIMALCEVSDGNIWIGTYGGGISIYNRSTGLFKHHKLHTPIDKYGLSMNDITALYEDSKGNLWIGNAAGGIDYFNRGTNTFIHYYPVEQNKLALRGPMVTSICEDKTGSIWVGTLGGLHRLVPNSDSDKLGSFKRYLLLPENLQQKSNTDFVIGINSLYPQDNDIIWIGTFGNGLIRFNTNTNVSTYFTEQNGLTDNTIYSIIPDGLDNLWLSTNKGLTRFDLSNRSFRNYDVKDGIQSNEFNQGAYFISNSGELFFGGVNGFNTFFAKEIKVNKYIPPVYLISFKVFDKLLQLPKSLAATKQIELTYYQNFFSFEFVALNYTAPEKNQYAYMLEGFDGDWHYVPSSQRYASYTNLNPGEYILKVKGSNNDGLWNEKGTSILLIITPPFWMTWWFRSIVIVLIVIVGGGTLRYFLMKPVKEKIRKMEQETILERERLRISRDMHDDLGSRLTEIRLLSEMVQDDSNGKAVAVLREVSETAKNIISTFGEIVWSVNPQNDNVEKLAEYIGQYAAEYLSKANIRCRVKLPKEFPALRVSSEIRHNIFLAVKEALNNAVKHSETTELHLSANIEGSVLIISIEDFGKGFAAVEIDKFIPKTLAGGNGLQNMKKRLEQIGGRFELESKIGTGTIIKFIIPLVSTD